MLAMTATMINYPLNPTRHGLGSGRSVPFSVLLCLLAAAVLPATAWAAPQVRCTLDQGGLSQVAEFAPVTDPYSVKAIDINGKFRFKAVVIGDEQKIQYVKLYTYYQTKQRLVLLHEVTYLAPEVQDNSSIAALTGWNYLYSPGLEREFQYGCALFEATP